MATAKTHFHPLHAPPATPRGTEALLRLLQTQRSEDVFPLLLEEIVALGYARAAILDVDFEAGEVSPAASLNWPRQQVAKFTSALWVTDHPLVGILSANRPAVLPRPSFYPDSLYLYPMLFFNPQPCWEAGRPGAGSCLAVENHQHRRRVRREDQACSACGMRAYAAVVVVELSHHATEASLARLGSMIDLANAHVSRLFKVEHYYNRMRDMEITIAQMTTVMQSMADPVILTDTQHRVIMQNRAAEHLFKIPDQTTEGLLRAVELNNLLFSAAVSSMASWNGDSHHDLTLVDTVEGEEMLFEAVSAPTNGPDGTQIGTVTVLRDVTKLRRADQELHSNYDKLREVEETVRQDRDRLNLIFENVGDPIVVCDGSGRIVMTDPLAQELFGLFGPSGRSESAGSGPQIRNQSRLAAHLSAFTRSALDRDTAPLSLYNPVAKQEIEYHGRSGKIYDERRQVAYTVTVLRDLTALRRLEQLKLERRMLEIEKFAATGRLAATIAHEVNNPMEAIKNAIYLLAGAIPESAMPVYSILKSETERVARVVRQMLGLYRNNEQVKPVNVNTIVEDTLMLLTRQLQRASLQVRTDLRPLPDAVIASDQIRQVLSNLVINAKDAMPQGGRLYVRTRHICGQGDLRGWVRILVGDSGVGIAPEMLPNIFEPFVTNKGEKGTGLGLWIVKGIVEHHAGRLRVRSRPGRGTVFRIDLPVAKP